jgi:hypothetical protein
MANLHENAAKRIAELSVEDAVDNRIHGAVTITEPGEDGEQ